MAQDLPETVRKITGIAVLHSQTLSGGSLSAVTRLTLADGRRVVAKEAEGAAREARMLTRMADAGVAVPAVLGRGGDVLVLEDLGDAASLSAQDHRGWAALARTLQPLHAATGPNYGWPEDHAFGVVRIVNSPTPDWPEFWAEHRLLGPAAELPAALRHRLNRLAGVLAERLPARPPPALLHGDLWSGNVLLPAPDRATLIDPACYYGDRRVDLAMLAFFSTPSKPFQDIMGISGADWPEICAIYQLWPAIVHLRLFGERYLQSVTGRLDRLGV